MRRREKAAGGLLLAGMVLLSCAEIWACAAGLGGSGAGGVGVEWEGGQED